MTGNELSPKLCLCQNRRRHCQGTWHCVAGTQTYFWCGLDWWSDDLQTHYILLPVDYTFKV